MQTDLYTKIILTIIAISLVIIALKPLPFLSNALAKSEETLSVNISAIADRRLYSGALPVVIKGE